MKRLLWVALALLILAAAKPVAAVDPTLELLTAGPYHFGQTVAVVVHGDVPGHPGEARPKAHLLIECDFGGPDNFSWIVYSPQEETIYAMPLGGEAIGGISNWGIAGGGPADCVLSVYATKYQGYIFTITQVWDTISFHVD